MIIKLKRWLFLDVAEDFNSVVMEVRDFDLKLSLLSERFRLGFWFRYLQNILHEVVSNNWSEANNFVD